jgi:hypothetical protein
MVRRSIERGEILKLRVLLWIGLVPYFTLASCAAPPHTIASPEPPGTTIVSFANTTDKNWTTTLSSQPSRNQAGVDGRVFAIDIYNGGGYQATELAEDLDGNLGIRGTLFSRSSRAEKFDIVPYRSDAVALIDRVAMVSYHYRNESSHAPKHVGFIAEDAPAEFVGPTRKSFNINNSLAVTMAATQELDHRIEHLEREVAELKDIIRKERTSR